MSTPPLPELADALVDADTIDRLFADLAAHTEVLHVIVRGRPQQNVSAADVPLGEAHARLMAGEVTGVQVLYRWEQQTWRDAVLSTAAGFRVVRMRAS